MTESAAVPWGRQTAVAMTPSDERVFINRLRGQADLTILRPLAPGNESLRLADLPPREDGMEAFYLWNRRFAWEPAPALTADGRSRYLPGTAAAPLIEYLQDPLRRGTGRHGRLYWAKSISPDGPYRVGGLRYAYDYAAFEPWYMSIVRWVRKEGTPIRYGGLTVYCLPGAARVYGI